MSAVGHQLPRRPWTSAAARHLITDTNAGGRRGRDGLKGDIRFVAINPSTHRKPGGVALADFPIDFDRQFRHVIVYEPAGRHSRR
jgi:hypothetical protein